MKPTPENLKRAATELSSLAFANIEFFPREGEALEAMARCLCEASENEAHMEAVVEQLRRTCKKSPSHAVILEAANGNRPEVKRKLCGNCVGGWRVAYFLHTREGVGQASYIRREILSESEYKVLSGLAIDGNGNITHPVRPKLDPQVQATYSGAGRCGCLG